MASSSTVPALSEMAELHAHGLGIPILFPVSEAGFACVSVVYLSIRFSFKESSILIEREIYDPVTLLVTITIPESSKIAENGSTMWELGAGKYRVYGLIESQMGGSTQILTPLRSSTSTLNTPLLARVKVDLGAQVIINIFDSSDEDAPTLPTPLVNPSPSLQSPCPSIFLTPSASPIRPSEHNMSSSLKPFGFIVRALCRLGSMPSSKNVLKKLDYDSLKIQEVNYLPPRFDGPCMFVLPPTGASSSQAKAKSMEGMDKRYDGHVWTKTQTTNISNDLGLSFRSSTCVGHLQCQNHNCDYLQRAHRTS